MGRFMAIWHCVRKGGELYTTSDINQCFIKDAGYYGAAHFGSSPTYQLASSSTSNVIDLSVDTPSTDYLHTASPRILSDSLDIGTWQLTNWVLFAICMMIVIAIIWSYVDSKTRPVCNDSHSYSYINSYPSSNCDTTENYSGGSNDIPYQYISPHYSGGNFVRGHYRKERGWKNK